jgi:hypothetical protein
MQGIRSAACAVQATTIYVVWAGKLPMYVRQSEDARVGLRCPRPRGEGNE